MDKFTTMAVFVAVAEEEGFAAAARKLQMSPPAVTRAIAALEQHLAIPLLVRTTRKVRLTQAGEQYLDDARRILADIKESEESVTGVHSQPSGQLVVTAPAMFGRLYVTPIITEYLRLHPQVSVSSIFVDRVTNLIEEGIDLGIRIGRLPDSSLRSVRLGNVMMKTYASAKYLQEHSTPHSPDDLMNHRTIVSLAGRGSPIWRFYHSGESFSVKVKPAFTSNTNDSVITAAVEGFGITRLLSYQAIEEVRHGRLVPILEEFDSPNIPVSLVHPLGRNVPARVRAFIDLASKSLEMN